MCVFAVAVALRLTNLQLIHHQEFSTLSQKNLIAVIPLPPTRGLIYDRNGILLAKNIRSYNLMLTPYKIKNIKRTIHTITKIIPLSKNELDLFYRTKSQHRRYTPIPLKMNLSEQQTDLIYANRYRLPGVTIKTKLIRQYPFKQYLGSVIGYVGRINTALSERQQKNYQGTEFIGKIGVEKYYENILHGTVGYAIAEINASGDIVRFIKKQPPVNGKNITLNIDSQLQKRSFKLMANKAGAIVAINPQNGNIIEMVSTPGYDPNQFVTGISQKQYSALTENHEHPLFNRSIRGLYSPGSTIKPFIAYYSLSHQIITPQSTIVDPGWFKLPHTTHVFHDWKYSGHGIVNVSKALVVSCDTFFYHLAAQLGIKKLDMSLFSFGFGHPTQVDIGEELQGIVPTPGWEIRNKHHGWYTGDTVITGIGQGSLLVTPLQLATATATLAAKGQHITPHLIHIPTTIEQRAKIQDPAFDQIHQLAWSTVTKAMQNVILAPAGTAINYGKDSRYSVAGKTGTVQVFKKKTYRHVDVKLIPKRLRNNHLFIAFAPVDNPRIAVAVVVEHASDADGIARHVIDNYLEKNPSYKPKA